MADSPYPDPSDDTDVAPDRGSPPGMPRWVKVSGIVVIILVLLVVIVLLTGIGGPHGPARHTPSGAGAAVVFVGGALPAP